MKKVMLTKSTSVTTKPSLNMAFSPPLNSSNPSHVSISAGGTVIQPRNSEIFEQRKAMKSAYTDLFKALFKIPDKQLQQRVMDAINGAAVSDRKCNEDTCEGCRKPIGIKRKTSSIATQTEEEKNENRTDIIKTAKPITLGEDHYDVPPLIDPMEKNKQISTEREPKKRKRRNHLPRVMKRSHAQQQCNLPVLNNTPSNTTSSNNTPSNNTSSNNTPSNKTSSNNTTATSIKLEQSATVLEPDMDNCQYTSRAKRLRCDFNTSIWYDMNTADTDINLMQLDDNLLPEEVDTRSGLRADGIVLNKVFDIMIKEYTGSGKFDMDDTLGYLPIHDALSENNLDRLQRQIYIWRKLKDTPLNEVLTIYGQDCMEVALNNNSSRKAIAMLLKAGFDVNCFYEDFGNVLHLAIDNEVDLETIELLTRQVEFDLLHEASYDGYSPLFLALRHNKYIYFETILQIIDERLNLKSTFKWMTNRREDSEKYKLKDFTEFYAKKCHFIKKIYKSQNVSQNKALLRKQKILDYPDPKSGKTMLLFAIEQHLEHFIFLLLANLANPLTQNYGGQSARSYYNEYGKSLKLNIQLDAFMENVESILH